MSDIIIENLEKSFGENQVFKGFSAVFKEGKITAVMGTSGCGKTTLLNILMGFEEADGGSVSGMPVKKGAVFQEDRLCEAFTAVTNIRMVLDGGSDERKKVMIREHLELLGFKQEELDKPVRDYSGGMKRRVAIARAVLSGGDILFMDEPFKGLDETTKKITMDYVKKYAKGSTVIFVTHDREEAEYMGSLVYNITGNEI